MDYGWIPSTISAICAFVTLIVYIKSNRRAEREKNEFVKAIFYVERKQPGISRVLELNVYNVGYQHINNLTALWDGNTEGIRFNFNTVKLTNVFNYNLTLNWTSNKETEPIKGYIVLKYDNIYGNKEQCKYRVELEREIDSSKGIYGEIIDNITVAEYNGYFKY